MTHSTTPVRPLRLVPSANCGEWWITFGVRYRQELHPTWPAAHPDGYLAISGVGYGQARDLANALLGHDWAAIYQAGHIPEKNVPLGELGRITVTVTS